MPKTNDELLHGVHWFESTRIFSVLVEISSESENTIMKNYDGSRNYMQFIDFLMLLEKMDIKEIECLVWNFLFV